MKTNANLRTLGVGTGSIDAAAPDEIVIFPPGTVKTTKYQPFEVDAEAGRKCIVAFGKLGRDMVIDYEHATVVASERHDGTAPAAGWIRSMYWSPQRGLIGQVEWTAKAKALIAAREYRYHSPVWFTEEGRLVEVCHVSLTNDPATIAITPLVASRFSHTLSVGDPMEELAKILGQKPDATPEQLAAAVNEATVAAAAKALGLAEGSGIDQVKESIMNGGKSQAGTAPGTPISVGAAPDQGTRKIAKAMGITETDNPDVLIASLKTKFVDAGEHAKLASRLEALEGKARESDFEAACNSAENAGKVTEANKPHLKVVFAASRASFDGLLKTLPVLAASRSMFEGDPPPTQQPQTGERKHFPDMNKVRENLAKRKLAGASA